MLDRVLQMLHCWSRVSWLRREGAPQGATAGEVTSRPKKKTVPQTTTKQHVPEVYQTSRKPVHYCLPYGKSSSCLASDPLDDCLLALSHRFHRILPQKSRSDLREIKAKHCQHRGQAIWYLKDKIGNLDKCRTDKTLVGVMMLLFSDAIYYDHFNAALEMIPLRGGVEKLLYSAAHLKALLLYFMTYDLTVVTESSVTRPVSSDHIPLGSDIRSIDVISHMYGDGFFPVLLCPPALLANIIRINHLRLQAFLHPSNESEGKALALLVGRITTFSPENWAVPCAAPGKGITLGHVYRSRSDTVLHIVSALSLQRLCILP
ncbi:hypothetical protein IFM46972_05675 [Aspergillus udagawae]|uniref:Uncharacterized protein n=1 Tax=Aspergillus udagawae TaxID=91492 RepID=A0A8H3NSV3_9EURO|nr:hypothetical protein IFM46972_05675 [Aspergillus udagawae]